MHFVFGDYPEDGKGTQLVHTHIDNWDTWGLDYTLACIIAPALEAFKATKSKGVPYEFIGDETSTEAYDRAFAEWEKVIDKMIFAFKSIVNDDDYTYDKDRDERVTEGLELFGRYFRNLWT